jgi:hypothetical protein
MRLTFHGISVAGEGKRLKGKGKRYQEWTFPFSLPSFALPRFGGLPVKSRLLAKVHFFDAKSIH